MRDGWFGLFQLFSVFSQSLLDFLFISFPFFYKYTLGTIFCLTISKNKQIKILVQNKNLCYSRIWANIITVNLLQMHKLCNSFRQHTTNKTIRYENCYNTQKFNQTGKPPAMRGFQRQILSIRHLARLQFTFTLF